MHTPSMMLDAQKCKPFEVEVIVAEVVRMAKSVGVDIPVSQPIAFKFVFCMSPC
jgi:ketopantoate reductase